MHHPTNAVLKVLQHRFEENRAIEQAGNSIHAVPGTTAVVLDSPHSGTQYPADFSPACYLLLLQRAQDSHVNRLFNFAPPLGVAWIEAHFARTYLDVNRDLTEVDTSMLDESWPEPVATDTHSLAKVRLGKGLIWRCTDEGVAIYDRKLTISEVRTRIATCWQPYHQAVARAIETAHDRHGYSIHINCHSMPAKAASHATEHPGLVHADFVIGNRDGSTSSPELAETIGNHLRCLGYSIAYNHPYKGMELVRRYSDPVRHKHSIQLEINRKLYMNERTLEVTQGYADTQKSLCSLVERLLGTDPR